MIKIPSHFFETNYKGSQYPGVAKGLELGANCQHFCYELLRLFNYEMGPLRSSELWIDSFYTQKVNYPQPLDLVLFNWDSNPYGAHMALYIGDGKLIHLSQKIGKPVVWGFDEFLQYEEYKILIGFKRPSRKLVSPYQFNNSKT